MAEPILTAEGLGVAFETPDGTVRAVTDLSFTLNKGECLGIVGESGSGKSQTFLAALGLLADNGTASGTVTFQGQNLLDLTQQKLNTIRGDRITMIFQDALTGLTPHMRMGDQLGEVLIAHQGLTKTAAPQRVLDLITRLRIPDPEKRLRMYPHELSGGMRQRMMIAMALLCEPDILIADEPTTALDVTIQAQVLHLLGGLKKHTKTSIILVTHDLGVVAGLCDRVMVMYAGRMVEQALVNELFYDPKHPYTRGLLASMPRLTDDVGDKTGRLSAIPGQPPNLQDMPGGCAFAPRCAAVQARCHTERPPLTQRDGMRRLACHLEGAS